MNEKSLFRVLNFFSANLKSQVQNPKWVGIFAIVLTFVFGGVVMAQAQQRPKIARIGILRVDGSTSPVAMESIDDLKRGLSNLGYVEGQNINFEIRRAENKLDRLPIFAAELVQLKVDVIVTSGPQATKATKEATNTIPIVMGRMDDVVEHGLVTSLARPGGNITGLSFQTGELSGKWLDLLKEVLPKLSRVAVLWDTSSTAGQLRTVEEATHSTGLHLAVSKVAGLKDFYFVFDGIRKERMEGLIILASPIFTAQRARLAELAAKQNLPAIYYHEGFTQAGGLLAYGPKQSEFSWHRAAIFVDKILKGAKPADLPVEQPTKFDFIINLKTAKQIGVTIPPNVLARADKVIR
jgi:putative ABC transport system substrate-binding protein